MLKLMRLLHLFLAIAFAAEQGSNDPLVSKYQGLVSWIGRNGGTVDPRITIGYDENGIRGIIAKDKILNGTVIMHIPGKLVISTSPGEYNDPCALAEQIHLRLEAGEDSKWHSYFDFDDSGGIRIPSEWDLNSRAIFELQGLPPSDETHRHIEWYKSHCKAGEEPSDLEMRALKIFLTRSADIGLIPLYEFANHHNGKINTYLEKDGNGGLKVMALADISVNAPIFTTYSRSGWESSVHLFNTYGFVEDYPQIWDWWDRQLEDRKAEDPMHHIYRYIGNEHSMDTLDAFPFEPSSELYHVLVLSPDIAALYPTKDLASILGNGQRSLEEWKELIERHHRVLRTSAVRAMQDSIEELFDYFPTTIEEDERILADERYLLEKIAKDGRNDVQRTDAVQAIAYRLAFKRALQLAADVAKKGKFAEDSEEL